MNARKKARLDSLTMSAVVSPHPHGGEHVEAKFKNGWGTSTIRTPHSYGGGKGFWEVAVIDKTGDISYRTPLTDDVMGWLSDEEVLKVQYQVATLPREGTLAWDILRGLTAATTWLKNYTWKVQQATRKMTTR